MGQRWADAQSVNAVGRLSRTGKTPGGAEQVLRDARAVEAAGAFAIVLEALPRELARRSRAVCGFPPLELARDRIATGRSWCCTTCWG